MGWQDLVCVSVCAILCSLDSVLHVDPDELKSGGLSVTYRYDKKLKKDMFFDNPAHQPNNIGYRKAWTSGGCEFNWGPGKIGHSVFTESPVWTAVLPSEHGDMVRVWEYDRLNKTTWQTDIILVDSVIWVHPTITNPNEHEVDGCTYYAPD